MKERLKAGAETFVEDQKLLYTVIYIGLQRAIETIRRPEVSAEVYELGPISAPQRQETIDTVYPVAA
ncbi:MAG TPA: hypothetical protein VIK37_01645 [Candidatus Saccharimonadales bacterium]